MAKSGVYRAARLCTGFLTIMAVTGFSLQHLPSPIGRMLILWVVMSVPLGIAVGHCALRER